MLDPRDPFELYARFRAANSVHQNPLTGFWSVFDYETVRRILRDSETYSSLVAGPRSPLSEWVAFNDPPRHTRLRSLVSRAFSPRGVALLEPRIRELSRSLLAPHLLSGEIELVSAYAAPLPLMVIAELLGLPEGELPRLRQWSDVVTLMGRSVEGGEHAQQAQDDFVRVHDEMEEFLEEFCALRRACKSDDLFSALLEAAEQGDRLTARELLGFLQVLLVAGHETTTNLIGNAVICLLDHPRELRKLTSDWALLDTAINEVLRFRPPVVSVLRLTRREVVLHGTSIPQGRTVVPVLASANRDPERFEQADRFLVDRTPNPHLAFGYGIHSCLGATLSRLEAGVALPDLFTSLRDLRPVPEDPWELRDAPGIHGPKRLRLRFQPVS